MTGNEYLYTILAKYQPRDLSLYSLAITELKGNLRLWASSCYLGILDSGSRAKGTAISLASDIDYVVSLTSSCNENEGGLRSIYESLYKRLSEKYTVRKQNVSVRILSNLNIDITPARRQSGNTNNHWLYVSKFDTWKQTNIKKHISDVLLSGRRNEIKLLKIWRELHNLDFPSIYLEYLVINKILLHKSKSPDALADNILFVLEELARDVSNPLYSRIVDPANSTNILSDLMADTEKNMIIRQAKNSIVQSDWADIVW